MFLTYQNTDIYVPVLKMSNIKILLSVLHVLQSFMLNNEIHKETACMSITIIIEGSKLQCRYHRRKQENIIKQTALHCLQLASKQIIFLANQITKYNCYLLYLATYTAEVAN